MIQNRQAGTLCFIDIEKIEVLNPRERNGRVFEEIVANIQAVGLKKPITVTPRLRNGEEWFLLVCGEGRVKAFKALGQSEIPAMVIDVSDEDAFVMSLVENVARRRYKPLESLTGIIALRDKGYDKATIAAKTGLRVERVQGILNLLERGEERLLVAVERGKIPLSAAMTIVSAGSDNKLVQIALQEAYESGELRGRQLFEAKRVMEHRRHQGIAIPNVNSKKNKQLTSSSLVRTYQKEVQRQQLMVRKAEVAQQKLLFVIGALRQLLSDENFSNLLRAEGLGALPTYLAERVWPTGVQP